MIELRPNRKQKHNSSHLKASNSLPVNFQLNPKVLAASQISMAYRQTSSRPFINNVDQIEDILVIPIHQNTIQGSPIFQHKLLAFGAEDLRQNFPPLEEVSEKEIEVEARLDTVNTILHTEENLTSETASENVVRQQDQGADFIDENMTQKASLRVLCQFIITILILIASSAGYLLLTKQIPIEIFFPIFILLASIYIIFLVKTNGFSFDQSKIDLLLSTGNAMSLIVFAIGAHIKVLAINFPLTPFCTPGILFLVGAGIRNCISKIEAGRALLAVYKAVIWLQIFLISLHIDGITMSWRHAFIPLYLVAMSLAFFGMLIIFATLLGFITMVKDEGITLENASGSLWYILNAFYIIVWLSILAQVVNKLENETGELESSLKAGIIHSAILFIYTLLLWRPLCRFQEVEIQSEESEDDTSTNKSAKPTFRVSRNTKDKLVMRSPTFFQYLKKTSKKNKQEQVTHRQNPTLESDIEKHTSSNHEKKENEGICAVCFDNVANAVLMDCGHGGICYTCALESWKKTDNCFMCRRKINKVLKIVHSKTGSEIKVLESIQKIPVINNYNI